MKKKILGDIIGTIMILFHFILIATVIFYYRQDKFLPGEITIILGMLIPMFAIYITSIIKNFIKNQNSKSKGKKVSWTYSFISFLIPLLYMIFVLFIIIDQAENGKLLFDDFTKMLTIAETIFGVFTGFIITDLFGEIEKKAGSNTDSNTSQ